MPTVMSGTCATISDLGFITNVGPYRKAEDNPKQLIIDEDSAAIVEGIFRLCVDGYGPAKIAKMLTTERILNPSAYKYEQGILKKARPCKDPYFWNTTTVHKILDAPEYLGQTVNFKTFTKSYKDKKIRPTPADKQLVLEELRDLLDFVIRHKKRFIRLVTDKSRQERIKEMAGMKRTAEKHRRRIVEIDLLVERLYTDNVSGKVNDEKKLSSQRQNQHWKRETLSSDINTLPSDIIVQKYSRTSCTTLPLVFPPIRIQSVFIELCKHQLSNASTAL